MDLFDLEAAEKAEAQIDQFIERRARENNEANRLEAAWAETTRIYNEKRRRENQALWYAYFSNLSESLRSRADDYEARALALLREPGGGG